VEAIAARVKAGEPVEFDAAANYAGFMREEVKRLAAHFGTVPPPWVVYDEHPYSICWRMRFRPEWRTPDAVAMASEMYARSDFVALRVLAEALREVGCEDPVLLRHCRMSAEHIPGCWVVDLVMGKE
jgi:hypothetical protein